MKTTTPVGDHPVLKQLREFALSLPEAYEEFPWGHSAIKVNKKIFLTLALLEERAQFSLKLTEAHFEALLLPFTEPSSYGLGKHGWVSSSLELDAKPPMSLLLGWVEESYRAVAPKARVAELDGAEPTTRPGKRTAVKKKAQKKAGKKAKKKSSKKVRAKPVKKAAKKTVRKTAKQTKRRTS